MHARSRNGLLQLQQPGFFLIFTVICHGTDAWKDALRHGLVQPIVQLAPSSQSHDGSGATGYMGLDV
eukprot:scaffold194251_cov17-Prasinocladus_malaysianus.AAC.2